MRERDEMEGWREREKERTGRRAEDPYLGYTADADVTDDRNVCTTAQKCHNYLSSYYATFARTTPLPFPSPSLERIIYKKKEPKRESLNESFHLLTSPNERAITHTSSFGHVSTTSESPERVEPVYRTAPRERRATHSIPST